MLQPQGPLSTAYTTGLSFNRLSLILQMTAVHHTRFLSLLCFCLFLLHNIHWLEISFSNCDSHCCHHLGSHCNMMFTTVHSDGHGTYGKWCTAPTEYSFLKSGVYYDNESLCTFNDHIFKFAVARHRGTCVIDLWAGWTQQYIWWSYM